MGKAYQVLLIEDNESDAELIQLELSKLDLDVEIHTIHKKKELSAHLKDTPPDLIISDYKLSGFTGIDALHMVREQYPDLPFILVSGYIGEEQAVDIMLEGASDYAMKDNLERLRAAVTREIQNYEQQLQKQQQLDQKQQRLQSIIDSVEGIVWEADAQTFEFHFVSSQVQKLLGYTPKEWLNTPNFWQDHIHPDDRQQAVSYCHYKTKQGENHEFEYRMRDASGNYVWLRDYVTVINQDGHPSQLRGIMVDITQQKKTERQRDNAYQVADIGHWELDLVNEELLWSDTVKKLHEVDLDYNPDLDSAIEFYKEGEDRQQIIEAVEQAIETGDSFEVELQIITAKGNQRWVRVVGETEFHDGKCLRIYGSTQDITDRKVSEKKYHDIFNLSPQPMWVYDLETLNFLDVNQAAIDQYGYSRDEFLTMTLKDIRANENIPKLEEAVKLSRGKEEFYFEGIFQHRTKDRKTIDVKIKSNIVDYQGRKAEMVLAEDITAQLKAEKELRVSEQKFKTLIQEGADMAAVVDQEGNYKFVSPNYEQITGWSPNDLKGQNAFEYIHPDDRERINNAFSNLAKTNRLQTLPFRFKHKNGDWLWVESAGTNISEEASIDGFIINSHDVTERRYYTELEKIERDILEKNIIGRLNLPDLAKKLLLKIEDLHPSMRCSIKKIKNGTIRAFAAPNLPSAYLDEIEGNPIGPRAGSCGTAAYLKEAVIVENIFEDSRWENYRHLGEKHNFSACWSQPVIDSNQNVLATFAIYYDSPQAPSEQEKNTIDRMVHLLRLLFDSYEKEKAEQELALSEHRFRSLVQEGAELIAILDEEANYKYVAPTAKSILGISADEFVGTNALDYIHQDDRERIASKLADLDKEERLEIEPFRFQDAEGNYRWVETVATNMLGNPAVEGIVANSRDVTERIERKKKLQESLQRYEVVSKATNDVIWDWNFNTDTVHWNKALQTLLGYNQLETSNQWWYDHIHPEDRDEVVQNIHNHIDQKEENWSFEYRFRCADGSYKVFLDRGFLLFDEDGEPQQMIGSMQDITERKEYENDLEQLSLVASKTTDVIFMTDPQEQITWVNNAFEQFSGYQSDELIGKSPGNILTGPDNSQKTMRRISNAFKKQEALQTIVLNYSKTGDKYWFDLTLDPVFDNEGNCDGFIGIQKDVTEQIEYQKELSENVDRYESVSKATSDTIWDLDIKTDTIKYNQNIYEMFGYEKQEVENIGDWWRNNIHPDDRAEVIETLEQALCSSADRFQMGYRFRAADGTYKYIYDRAFIVEDQEGNPIRVIGAMQDVTRQREERKWLQLFESAVGTTTESVAIIEAEPTAPQKGRKIIYINEAFTEMTGYGRKKAIGQTLHLLNGPKTDSEKIHQLGRRMDNWETSEVELINYKKNGDPFWIYISMAPVKNRDGSYSHWVCVGRDITDRRQYERELKHSLKEKETLLLEIHHRVKNNLAVVSGMMQLQAFEEDDEQLREKLLSSVARIQTMGSIHELLYQSESFSSLAFDENIKRLVENITQTMQTGSELNIDFEISPITLNINQAIPCSLIINEVITNIIKHAFPKRERGTIQIHGYEENGEVSLTIKDNGQGLPDNFDEQKSKGTLGLKLIDTLATQLESEYNYKSSPEGTTFKLTFEKSETKGVGNALLGDRL